MRLLSIRHILKHMEVVRKHFESLDSTNSWAKRNTFLLPLEKMTLVTAGEQTAGRGRFKREWVSPSGQNVYATFCFRIEKACHAIGNLPQILALSTLQVLENQGFKPKLKWPNDILINGKKVAGILCETTPLSDHLMVALGIGLNINMPLNSLQKIDRPATSLFAESGQHSNVEHYIQLLQETFTKDLSLFLEEGFIPFYPKYKEKIIHHPQDLIRFHDNRILWEGAFKEIAEDGSLFIKLSNGEIKRFISGEII